MSVAPFYEGWRLMNDGLVSALEPLSAEQLALPVGSATWPVWASAAHVAGARVFWLCHVLHEAGAETTPFVDPSGAGWEDDLAHPRSGPELAGALRSSWRILEGCLERWTPEMLREEFPRTSGGVTRLHTRQSVLWRLVTHDAYHCGEIALVLGGHGLGGRGPNGPIDMWSGLARAAR